MYSELIGKWVKCRDGQFGCVQKIDKAGYFTIVDAEGNTVKGHEPAHTVTADFRAEIAGAAAQARLRLKGFKVAIMET